MLDALRHIHGRGKLHGDLKPDGILVAERGGRAEVTLVDAGFDFAKGTHLPTIGGTLPYLAPEIIRNQPADGRSDLYSLGVALYEVLTGSRPFEGATQEEILARHLEHRPAPVSHAAPGVDRGLGPLHSEVAGEGTDPQVSGRGRGRPGPGEAFRP